MSIPHQLEGCLLWTGDNKFRLEPATPLLVRLFKAGDKQIVCLTVISCNPSASLGSHHDSIVCTLKELRPEYSGMPIGISCIEIEKEMGVKGHWEKVKVQPRASLQDILPQGQQDLSSTPLLVTFTAQQPDGRTPRPGDLACSYGIPGNNQAGHISSRGHGSEQEPCQTRYPGSSGKGAGTSHNPPPGIHQPGQAGSTGLPEADAHQALRAEKQAAGRAAVKAIKLAQKYSRKLEEEYRLVLSKLGMVKPTAVS